MSRTPDSSAVLAALRTAFGADEVLAGDASPRHLRDWSTASGGVPLAILRPRSTEELSRSAAEIALMRTLKQSLDPRGILNPGKML